MHERDRMSPVLLERIITEAAPEAVIDNRMRIGGS